MANIELFEYNKFYSTTENYSIKNFTIYGERHSGTNWLERLINRSFRLPITWEYDYKHFFGCCDWAKLNEANNTLFIGIVRNIYNWIGAMEKIPYHLPSKNVIDISPWISNRHISGHGTFCDSHWYTKEKYKDIFHMRHHKIEFMYIYMPFLVNNYVFIRYEDLIEHTEYIITIISNLYNLNLYSNKYTNSDKSKLNLYRLSNNYFHRINNNTIWQTENMIGYKQINELGDNYRFITESVLDKPICSL